MSPDWMSESYGVTPRDIRRIVLSVCRVQAPEHADDVFGDVCLRIQEIQRKNPTYFQNKWHLLGTCRKEAHYCLTKILKKLRKLQYRDPIQLPEPDSKINDSVFSYDYSSELPIDRGQLESFLVDANPTCREIVILKLEGMNGKQIAEKLHISDATVSRRLREAEAIVWRKLEDR